MKEMIPYEINPKTPFLLCKNLLHEKSFRLFLQWRWSNHSKQKQIQLQVHVHLFFNHIEK